MARIPKVKVNKASRRYGVKLSQSEKSPVQTRAYPPGIHGPKRRARLSEYGSQLKEKQMARIMYGVMEKQFAKYYEKASKQSGDTGEILQQLLETRLDNVVYRAGFAKTRRMARQMVSHRLLEINGKRIDVPSYQVRIKDEITIKPSKAGKKIFAELTKTLEKHTAPSWLKVDKNDLKITVVAKPTGDELEKTFNPRLIVEYYSR